MKDIDDTAGTAEHLGTGKHTLEIWRSNGTGPPYVKVGGALVRYRKADVDRWLEQQTITPGAA